MSHRNFKAIKRNRAGFRPSAVSLLAVVAMLILQAAASGTLHAQSTNFDNFGTEFYVAFGPNEGYESFSPPETENVMDLYITSHVPAHGEVDVPALNFYQTFTTTPGQITTIVLPNGNNFTPTVVLPESQDEQVIQGMAVHVSSDSEVAVFGMNHKMYSSDAFMALPVNVLGTEYRTMNYNTSFPNQDNTPGEFVIVAVDDSTNVTITLRDVSSQGTPANKPQQIRMNKGDAYLVEGSTTSGSNDLTGSLIESDYPIAVLSGHKRTAIPDTAVNIDRSPSRDILVEQLPPVSAWGDSALVVPYATSALPDLVRVVCAEDSTQITVNGTAVAKTFNAGDFYEITHLQGVTSIQASKPIEVGQYMHTSWGGLGDPQFPAYGDPAYSLVFPVEQFQSSYTIISVVNPDAFSGNFVNIVADASSIGTMTIDGAPINTNEFKPIPNTRFDYAQHQLVQGTHNLSCSSPFGVTIYALGPVDSYSNPGGTLLKTITPLETVGLIIDFGDRVLNSQDLTSPYRPYPLGRFDTTVVLKNISQDTVNIYSFPKRIQDTDRFNVIATSAGPITRSPYTGLPLQIPPLGVDSFTIEFWPHEINRRMHTQITANTDHLRAYVVDVYGRGVEDDMGVFSDTNKTVTIDTLNFGTFTDGDNPSDSEVFVGNAGSDSMSVNTISITDHSNPNPDPFTESGILYKSGAVTTPFIVAAAPSSPARIGLQFTPSGQLRGIYSDSLIVASTSIGDTNADGAPLVSTHIVVLIGRVDSIASLQTGVNTVTWGTTAVCTDSEFNILVPNPNDVPVTITSANIVGANASDFALSTRTPLVIPAGQTDTVQVHFLPTARGARTAQAILTFNLPKNAPIDTINLTGTGDKPTLELAGQQNVHAYILDNYFLMPIYAKTNMDIIGCDGYHIFLNYDSVNLKLLDVISAGTLTPFGYLSIQSSTPPGRDTINFQQGGEGSSIAPTLITGGGCFAGDSNCLPLLYLKFQAVLNGSEDPADASPLTFEKGFPVNFSMTFDDARLPYACADHIFDSGYAVVGPVCDTQFLEQQPTIPDAMMLGTPTPNPANMPITVQYDVASVGNDPSILVTIDLVNAQGNRVATLVNEEKQPGYYNAAIDPATLPSGLYFVRMSAGNYQRIRNLVIQK
jgi:IgGFc binding protein/Secretion system C-terminal sorting domain